MKRLSSVRAWNSAPVQKVAATLRDRALDVLRSREATGAELNQILGSSSAHKRLSELEAMGLIEQRRIRECSITGQRVTVWAAIDGATPRPIEKPKTPTRSEMREGFNHFCELAKFARRRGFEFSPELIRFSRELRRKYDR